MYRVIKASATGEGSFFKSRLTDAAKENSSIISMNDVNNLLANYDQISPEDIQQIADQLDMLEAAEEKYEASGSNSGQLYLINIEASRLASCLKKALKGSGIEASTQVTAATDGAELDDKQVLQRLGRANYDQMYKAACRKIDTEIVNQYGEVEIDSWENGGCTATEMNGMLQITCRVYASFQGEDGTVDCYGEVQCSYDGNRASLLDPEVTYFTDEMEYQ